MKWCDAGLEKKSKLQFLPGKDNDNQKYNDKHRQEKDKMKIKIVNSNEAKK